MSHWIWHGLRRGILTTPYPRGRAEMPPQYRGAVTALEAPEEEQRRGAGICPTGAIAVGPVLGRVNRSRCVQCGCCALVAPNAFAMSSTFEIADYADSADSESLQRRLLRASKLFGRSVHLRHVDAGSDGSEEQELQAIFNPFYDANRLGIFVTATPRHADILIVSGAVTERMLQPLWRAYEAMPEPRIVIALGTTACSGAVFGDKGPALGGVHQALPVDVLVPGSPPAPLSILHGLLLALARITRGDIAS